MPSRPLITQLRFTLENFCHSQLCICCGIHCDRNTLICVDCAAQLPRVSNPCLLCGLPNHRPGEICGSCLNHPPRWSRIRAPFVYNQPVRDMLLSLKFNDSLFHVTALVEACIENFCDSDVEALVPVPLHPQRLLQRGFNQSQEIAVQLAMRLNIPLASHCIERIKITEPQSGLSLNQRKKNIRGAFKRVKELPQRIAVVDDVITSGSTLDEVVKVIQRAQPECKIEIWSLARALKHD